MHHTVHTQCAKNNRKIEDGCVPLSSLSGKCEVGFLTRRKQSHGRLVLTGATKTQIFNPTTVVSHLSQALDLSENEGNE